MRVKTVARTYTIVRDKIKNLHISGITECGALLFQLLKQLILHAAVVPLPVSSSSTLREYSPKM